MPRLRLGREVVDVGWPFRNFRLMERYRMLETVVCSAAHEGWDTSSVV